MRIYKNLRLTNSDNTKIAKIEEECNFIKKYKITVRHEYLVHDLPHGASATIDTNECKLKTIYVEMEGHVDADTKETMEELFSIKEDFLFIRGECDIEGEIQIFKGKLVSLTFEWRGEEYFEHPWYFVLKFAVDTYCLASDYYDSSFDDYLANSGDASINTTPTIYIKKVKKVNYIYSQTVFTREFAKGYETEDKLGKTGLITPHPKRCEISCFLNGDAEKHFIIRKIMQRTGNKYTMNINYINEDIKFLPYNITIYWDTVEDAWRLEIEAYNPVISVQEMITNGNFETGDFTGWEHGTGTGGTVDVKDYFWLSPPCGDYAAQLLSENYPDPKPWISQTLSSSVPKEDISEFSFRAMYNGCLPSNIRVTIGYSDGSETTQDFTLDANWTTYNLLQYVTDGKSVKSIKIEQLDDFESEAVIDCVTLKAYTESW